MSNTSTAAPHHAARLRTPKRLRWLHAMWLALAFCLSAALAPQAFAAACPGTSPLTLVANQWRLVGIPCVPVQRSGGSPQVGNVFLGNNLVAANYFTGSNAATATWVLWKRTYAATGDSYTRMAVTDPIVTGGAYWLYTRVVTLGNTFQVNGTATAGPSYTTTPVFAPQLAGTNRYIMYANPYATTNPLNFSALLFSGVLFGFLPTGDTSTADAITDGYISQDVSYWNGNSYFTRSPSSVPVATFPVNETAWIKVLPAVPAAGITQTKIKANRP